MSLVPAREEVAFLAGYRAGAQVNGSVRLNANETPATDPGGTKDFIATAEDGATTDTFTEGVLADLPRITLPAKALEPNGIEDQTLVMIPYFAWSNRDRSSMITSYLTIR